jgi:PAS domain S-box-containing protein
MQKAVPVDEEIKLDKYKYIMSRTNERGVIEYGNDYFYEISGYSATELVGAAHSIVRHPDMPRVIFKVMWDRLKNGKPVFAIVKNLAKDGRYYWVTTRFDIKRHLLHNTIEGYVAYRQAAKPQSIKRIEPLYQKLLSIEASHGISAAEKYLIGYLEAQQMSYDALIDDIAENGSSMKLFFQTMIKFFGSK